jgi:hypothetical protein
VILNRRDARPRDNSQLENIIPTERAAPFLGAKLLQNHPFPHHFPYDVAMIYLEHWTFGFLLFSFSACGLTPFLKKPPLLFHNHTRMDRD